MNTYTTQSGSKLEANGERLIITTASGKSITVDLATTTDDPKIYGRRILMGVSFDAATADWVDAQYAAYKQAKEDALESAIPGIHEAMILSAEAYNERSRYSREFSRMMEDESNDGARPPKSEDRTAAQKLNDILTSNPRVALYLKAKSQDESTSWADNTGKGAAGRKAMEILTAGGSIQDATAALAARREFVD